MHDATSGRSVEHRNSQDLEKLLLRFDSDLTLAGEKYEATRRRLIKFFEWNHCSRPEDLADIVFDRVEAKLDSQLIREVEKFCFAVARLVRLEAYRNMRHESAIEDLPGGGDALPDFRAESEGIIEKVDQQKRIICLKRCLDRLAIDDRRLIIRYYSVQGKGKTMRQKLAEGAGFKLSTLRVRISRLRVHLEDCVKRCLADSSFKASEGVRKELTS